MSEQTPPPPPPPGPPAPEAAAPAVPPPPPDDTPAAGTSGSGRGKKAVIGGIAAALVLGGGYGAYAVYDRLDGGGPQPHDVMPASTEVYARVDLDPSASQKIDLFRLIRKVPDLASEIGIKDEDQDIRELVFGEILSSECDDVDYDTDVEPWLGDRIGVGGSITDETFLIAVQTTDEDASREGIKKIFECSGDPYGIAYLDGYALVSDQQKTVDEAVAATAKGTLGDRKEFADDIDELGNQGVASAWADVAAIAESPAIAEQLGAQATELAKSGTIATTLRADGNAIELAVLGGFESVGDASATPLSALPADTVAALSIAGVGDQVTEAFDSFVKEFDSAFNNPGMASPTPIDPPGSSTSDPTDPTDPLAGDDPFGGDFGPGTFSTQNFIDEIERNTGFKLPEDLATLFGDSLTLAIGAENLETLPTLSGPDAFGTLDVALSLKSDQASALDLVQRIATLAESAGIPLVASPTDDGAVLATNQGAADAVAEPDGALGDDDVFTSVIPDGDSAYGGLYVNIGTILDKLLEADPPPDVRSGIEQASSLSALGASVSQQDGDRSLTRLRLSFK